MSYDRYEPAKSLVSPQFVAAPRWIGDPYRKDGLREFDQLPQDKADGAQETASTRQ
ncbi:Phosphoethanolamine transferase EptC [compost metagenome]